VTEFVSKLADTFYGPPLGLRCFALSSSSSSQFNITIGNTRPPACAELRCGLPVNSPELEDLNFDDRSCSMRALAIYRQLRFLGDNGD
jgi:hypothetical protein